MLAATLIAGRKMGGSSAFSSDWRHLRGAAIFLKKHTNTQTLLKFYSH